MHADDAPAENHRLIFRAWKSARANAQDSLIEMSPEAMQCIRRLERHQVNKLADMQTPIFGFLPHVTGEYLAKVACLHIDDDAEEDRDLLDFLMMRWSMRGTPQVVRAIAFGPDAHTVQALSGAPLRALSAIARCGKPMLRLAIGERGIETICSAESHDLSSWIAIANRSALVLEQ